MWPFKKKRRNIDWKDKMCNIMWTDFQLIKRKDVDSGYALESMKDILPEEQLLCLEGIRADEYPDVAFLTKDELKSFIDALQKIYKQMK